jgi:chemotaxis response regulator CheB
MAKVKVFILEGSGIHSFFFRETLLGQGLAQHVDLATQAEQAVKLIQHSDPYDLLIIDLVESWDEGMQFGFWLNQQCVSCPVMLIIPPETPYPSIKNTSFTVVSAPLSLRDFTEHARSALSTVRP